MLPVENLEDMYQWKKRRKNPPTPPTFRDKHYLHFEVFSYQSFCVHKLLHFVQIPVLLTILQWMLYFEEIYHHGS